MTTNYQTFNDELSVCQFIDELGEQFISVVNIRNSYVVFYKERILQNSKQEGDLIGAFRLLRKEDARRWKVECRICGLIISIDSSNMHRQKSCGCKPRHIVDVIFDNEMINYRCKKCGKWTSSKLPLTEEWCCDK